MLNQRLLLYNGILSMIFHRVRTLSCIEPTTFLANFLLRGAWEIKHYKCGFKKKTSERTVYQSISVCLQIWIFTNASSLIIMPKFLLFFFFPCNSPDFTRISVFVVWLQNSGIVFLWVCLKSRESNSASVDLPGTLIYIF